MSNQKTQGGFRMKQTHQFLQTETPAPTQQYSYLGKDYKMTTSKTTETKPSSSSLQGLAIRPNISAQADYM